MATTLKKEIWSGDIEKNLWPENSILKLIGKDDSNWVNNKTVNLPQSGTIPTVKKNRSILPASISTRTDSILSYDIDEYSVDPIVLNNAEDMQFLSYDKRMDVSQDQIDALQTTITNHTLYNWGASSSAYIRRTTGSTSTGSLVHSTATGSRKLTTLDDLAAARKILDSLNLGQGKVYMIVPSNMYWNDLIAITQITKYLEFGKAVTPTGVIGNVLGMDIIMRSNVLAYDSSAVRKTLDEDGTVLSEATGDNNSIMVVHEKYVRKAKGAINSFVEYQSPIYFGDLISSQVFHGSSKSREDGKGIVQIVQTT